MVDRLPLATGVPVPDRIVSDAAGRHAVDETDLADVLATIHADLLDGADAIHERYLTEKGTDRPPITAARGLVEVIYVNPEQWHRLAERLDVAAELRAPAMAAHAEYARELGGDPSSEFDALLIPSHTVAGLVRAGLSKRQAEVQVLRMEGHTQEEIGDSLGMELGTAKSHCSRIDRKVREADRLLDIVGERFSGTAQ